MLLKIKINNFLGFKESEIDFTAKSENIKNSTFSEKINTINNKQKSIKLYKSYIFFGKDKKDILKDILIFLKNIIIDKNTKLSDYSNENISYINIDFICNRIKYNYEIHFNASCILKETFIGWEKGEPKQLFERNNNNVFGISNKYLFEVYDNQSFLLQYLKINELFEIRDYFSNINFDINNIKENSINYIQDIDFRHITQSYEIIKKAYSFNNIQFFCSANNPTLIRKNFNMFRKYQVWFFEKDYDNSNIIYSAGETSVRKERDLEELYLNGRFCDIEFI